MTVNKDICKSTKKKKQIESMKVLIQCMNPGVRVWLEAGADSLGGGA